MTVVARLAINDYPMLIGDLLLSIEDPLASPSSVPTVENLSVMFPAGSARVPCGLRQKVAVVADNLVVGWSGSLNTAWDVIAELKRKSQSQPFTYETLTKHFDSLSQRVWDEIGLVGVLEESQDRVFHWGRKSREADTKLFGRVGLLGSGLNDVEKMLLDIPNLPVGLERTLLEPEQALGFCFSSTARGTRSRRTSAASTTRSATSPTCFGARASRVRRCAWRSRLTERSTTPTKKTCSRSARSPSTIARRPQS